MSLPKIGCFSTNWHSTW